MTQEQFSFFWLGVVASIGLYWLGNKIKKIFKPKKQKTTSKPRAVNRFCHDCGHVHSIPDNQPANG